MAKILWIGDGGCHTGFAQVTHNIGDRLVRDYGHEIHVLACNYKGDPWDTPMKLYVPNFDESPDRIGQHRIIELLGSVMPDVVVFVQDPAVVLQVLHTNPWDRDKVLLRGIKHEAAGYTYKPPILAYLAVDGYNNPRAWDALADQVTRVAMTHHGQQAMPEAPVIWHGVDTEVFHPGDKREAKMALGMDPDRFLVLRVDKNTWRKDYPASWKALAPVMRRHSDIDVHFHCRPAASDGYDLQFVVWNDEDIRDRLHFTPDLAPFKGSGQEKLATLYRAADLFLSTSWGEGFGLTILEAMASGTPVLAQDCSAITEVVGEGGILVKPAGRMHVPMGQEQCRPDIDRFSYWIERLYESSSMREGLARAAVEQASKFSWDEAARRFDQLLTASAG